MPKFDQHPGRLNCKIGKTNLILRLTGPGSVEIRQQLEDDEYRIKCVCGGTEVLIPIVEAYQHLGRLTCADRALSPDIKMRSGQCDTTLRPLAQKAFRAPGVGAADKSSLSGRISSQYFV